MLVRYTDSLPRATSTFVQAATQENLENTKIFANSIQSLLNILWGMLTLQDRSLEKEYNHLKSDADEDDSLGGTHKEQSEKLFEFAETKRRPLLLFRLRGRLHHLVITHPPVISPKTLCCVCLSNPKNTAETLQTRMYMCMDCAPKVKQCPLCMKEIRKFMKVYVFKAFCNRLLLCR